MTMYILIEHKPEGSVTASLIGWPDITAQGRTEDEAVNSLHISLTTHLRDVKVIPLELGVEPPWLLTVGVFKDDPFAHELDALVADHRRERNAEGWPADVQDHAA